MELRFDEVTRIIVVPNFHRHENFREWVRIAWKGKTIGYITKAALKEQEFTIEP